MRSRTSTSTPPGDPVHVIAGPTASGKTALGIEEALAVNGEVISADSRQIFAGMAIGTAAPTPDEQRAVPHHFVGVRDPLDGPFSAGAFAQAAEDRIEEIRARGRVPIVVGGTGFYLRALILGIPAAPRVPEAIRVAVARDREEHGLPALLNELSEADPEAYSRIDRHNPARVQRAIEVIRATGRPFSAWKTAATGDCASQPRHRYRLTVLSPAPPEHRRAIRERVEAMMEAGWIDETRALLARGVTPASAALQTIGYREIVERLIAGVPVERGALIDAIETKTWQYVRRQRTYFRQLVSDCNNGSIEIRSLN